MSSTTGSQNLLVNVFRPVYTYSSGQFTSTLELASVGYSGNTISVFTAAVGDAAENVYVGSNAGNAFNNIQACSSNTVLGYNAAGLISNVSNSTYLGANTGFGVSNASNVIAIGANAGGAGTSNIFVGNSTQSTGSRNILIGHGINSGGSSNLLRIGNNLYGNLANRWVGIGTDTSTSINNFDVSGNAKVSGILSAGAFDVSAIASTNLIVPGYIRNAVTPTQFDISGGNISNSGSNTTNTTITRNLYAPSTTDVSAISYINMGTGQNGGAGGPSSNLQFLWLRGGGNPFRYAGINYGSFNTQSFLTYNGGGGTLVTKYMDTLPTAQSQLDACASILTLTSTGRVGIGTAAPLSILDISGQDTTLRIADQRTTGIPSIEFIRGTSTTYGGDVNTDWRIRNSNGSLFFNRADNTGVAANNGDFGVMTFDGRMGIGTTAPTALLEVAQAGTGVQASTMLYAGSGGGASGSNLATSVYKIRGGGGGDVSGALQFNLVEANANFGFSVLDSNAQPYLRFDGTNDRLGVGTLTPQTAIDVSSSGVVTATLRNNAAQASIRIAGNGVPDASGILLYHNTTDQGVYSSNAQPLHIWTNNTRRITVLSNGNVGISSSNPVYRLDTLGVTRFETSTSNSSVTNNVIVQNDFLDASNNTGRDYIAGNILLAGGTAAGVSGEWYGVRAAAVIPSGQFQDTVRLGLFTPRNSNDNTSVERLTILSGAGGGGGRVGIGTTAPGRALDVSGTAIVQGKNAAFRVIDTSTAFIDLLCIANDYGVIRTNGGIDNFPPGTLASAAGGITPKNRLSADSGASWLTGSSVGIGTVSPGTTLDISGTTRTSDLIVPGTSTLGNASLYVANNASLPASTGSQLWVAGGYPSPTVGRIVFGDGSGWYLRFARRVGSATTDLMSIGDNGFVGIGTTVPQYALDVSSGSVYTAVFRNNSTQAAVSVAGNGLANTDGISMISSSNACGLYSAGTAPLHVYNGGFIRTTLLSSGNFGINRQDPSHALDVNGTIRGSSNIVAVATASNWVATPTSITDTSLTIAYTPKQSTAASVRLFITGNVDTGVGAGSGFDETYVQIRNNATVLTQFIQRGFDQVMDGRSANRYHGGRFAVVTVAGNATSLINMRIVRGGDDTPTVENGYLRVEELSTT
jgi:hypothetical protein